MMKSHGLAVVDKEWLLDSIGSWEIRNVDFSAPYDVFNVAKPHPQAPYPDPHFEN